MKIPKDTHYFKYYNANPKNKHTTDCVIRAICTALNQNYETTLQELVKMQLKTGYDISDVKCFGKYLELKGWTKQKQPRKPDNKKYTGDEFCSRLNCDILAVGKSVIANIGGHHIVCIKETEGLHGSFKIFDIWGSANGCIGNYWIRQ